MDIMETIKDQISSNRVILYMKGSPNQPQCGFSARTVQAALGHWRPVALRHGWDDIILSDDPGRGGKLATFVMEMARDTSLAYGSISAWRLA